MTLRGFGFALPGIALAGCAPQRGSRARRVVIEPLRAGHRSRAGNRRGEVPRRPALVPPGPASRPTVARPPGDLGRPRSRGHLAR